MPKPASKYKSVRFFGVKGRPNSFSTKLRAQDAELIACSAVTDRIFFLNIFDNEDGTRNATLVPGEMAKPKPVANDDL